MWRKNRLAQLGIPDLNAQDFFMWGISAAAVIGVYLSVNQKSQLLNFRWGCKADCERMCVTRGEEGKLELQQDRMIASALSWGLADPILSAPTLSWPIKDTNLGRLRFFPGQTGPTVSPIHFCSSFPRVFISLIYSPNYDQAEIPILWPPDAKNQFIGKDPDVGKDWGQEEKGVREDKMIVWHHQHSWVWANSRR